MKPDGCSLIKVADLICNFRWDRDIIRRNFIRKNMDLILQIPINLAGKEDSDVWKFSTDGVYSMSSGYKVCIEKDRRRKEEESNNQDTSDCRINKKVWKTLWN
ncbi:hypothetical protein ACH5RR_012953 [Cinchona calisaya]|uniref:Uncharacterized protein n=1 Tax=Cinchona calisaya TaxID=153742 RepID=A0ABD2ZYP7_9GENT